MEIGIVLYVAIALGLGWWMRPTPDEGVIKAWGIVLLWAVFWPLLLALWGIFALWRIYRGP